MPSLAEVQANFIATINEGPGKLDPAIFAGDAQRVFLGLKAHANTISHARLVALEETFPRLREAMGDEGFNQLSRAFCDTPAARVSSIDQLGAAFITFIEDRRTSASASDCDLAKIEWLWLDSYNAPEAEIMELAQLSGISEEGLIAMLVTPHPAANMVALSAPLSPALTELQEAGEAHAILITRPEAQPVLTPLDPLTAQLYALIDQSGEKTATIGNLLEFAAEQGEDSDALSCLITLINVGALQTL